jgi:hypothetical protein
MFSKFSSMVATMGVASALTESTEFLKTPLEHAAPQELGTISTGTYPCIFQVDNNFYDYTPFKLAYSAPVAAYGEFNTETL